MRGPHYEYPDEDGAVLTVNPYPHAQAGDIAAVRTGGTVYVLPEHFRDVAAGLWTGAGLPAPVILERPEPRDVLVPGAGSGRSWVEVERRMSADRSSPAGVMLSVACNADGRAHIRLAGDEPLRVALALVDAMNGTGDEPDPAEVAELAAVLRQGGAGLVTTGVDDIARTALRWMRDKQQRGESRDG